MPVFFLVGIAVILLWSLVAHRFERIGALGPAFLALAGAVLVFADPDGFSSALAGSEAERVVELVLAVLLFVDACDVRGGVFGGVGRALARLVLIALPLALILAVLAGFALLPDVNVLVLVVIACVVMPTDFAPAAMLLRSPRIPERVRRILTVESGYNDGVVSPIFGVFLAAAVALPALLAAAESGADLDAQPELVKNLEDMFDAFFGAAPATIAAIVIGGAVGGAIGILARWTVARRWADASGIRYVMLLTPLLAYGIATLSDIAANGFVAAFVAGIVYRLTRAKDLEGRNVPHAETLLVEEAGTLAANIIWFVMGAVLTVVILDGVDLRVVIFAALAVTVLRAIPVGIALLRSPISWRDRALIGFVGPRGTATIVFGLLAYNRLPEDTGDVVLSTMVFTVVLSILFHGVVTPFAVRRLLPEVSGRQIT
ncbi:cation:proton antiporter [Microbacterium proteolyticum]|uniref:cation:proton antiporter domain-containing protein n=1 Tax=Microbacterium proteolyticum TaxID=1572644 RepID=UPI00241632E1|nr:cation:proton antiporter [Microbacterium proteolyticum]